MTLGDRIVIMRDGFIQQIGTPQEVFNHPKNLFVASFIGTPQMNFFNATLKRDARGYYVELLGKEVVLSKAQQDALTAVNQQPAQIVLGVRPVNLSVAQVGFAATIDVSEMMGSEMHLHMSVGDKDVVAVIPTAGLDLDAVRSGNGVKFTFDPALAHLFDPETGLNLL